MNVVNDANTGVSDISSSSSSSSSSKKYFIIALDGGGVRCALQIVLLKRIFNRFPELQQCIRLVAGTSAGALVGAALGALGCEKMSEHMLSQEFAKKIFSESWTHEVRSMRGLYRASYTNKDLRVLLCKVFGPETPLNHYCIKKGMPDLLVTSFCIDTNDATDATEKGCTTTATTPSVRALAAKRARDALKEIREPSSLAVVGGDIELQDWKPSERAQDSDADTTRDANADTTREADADKVFATEETEKDVVGTAKAQKDQTKKEVSGESSGSRWSSAANALYNYTSSIRLPRWKADNSQNATMVDQEQQIEAAENLPPSRQAIIEEACEQKKNHQKLQHKCVGQAWHAQLYHTFDESGDATFVDVLLKSTAAPTYFPAHNGCIDGGIVAQNPSMLAISHALKYVNARDKKPLHLENIVLLSIGTGTHPMNMNAYGKGADLGLAQWMPNLMSVFNDGSLDAADINCRNLLPNNQYIRLQIKLPRDVDLANYNEWDQLVEWAEQESLDDVYEQLENLFFFDCRMKTT